MSLQTECWESVARRGFFHDENIPTACHNVYQMEYFLAQVTALGKSARGLRKNASVTAGNGYGFLEHKLLLSQLLRLVEEVGELADAVQDNNQADAITEAADVFVTLANVMTALGGDLESTVRAKLQADELRGQMHGERVTEVTA